MPLSPAPNTGWVSVTTSAAALSGATSVPIHRGVKLVSGTEFSIGTSSSVTHKTNAVTDGFPIPANTIFEVTPSLWPVGTPANLNSLYAIAAGTVNVFLIYPRA